MHANTLWEANKHESESRFGEQDNAMIFSDLDLKSCKCMVERIRRHFPP